MELFCIDHLLMVEILSHQDMLTIDFAFPTTPGGATGEVTGLEAALQVPPPRVSICFAWGGAFRNSDGAHSLTLNFKSWFSP